METKWSVNSLEIEQEDQAQVPVDSEDSCLGGSGDMRRNTLLKLLLSQAALRVLMLMDHIIHLQELQKPEGEQRQVNWKSRNQQNSAQEVLVLVGPRSS